MIAPLDVASSASIERFHTFQRDSSMFDRFASHRGGHKVSTKLRKPRRGPLQKPIAALESLEDRTLLTAYLVDTTVDNIAVDGKVSLREAILASSLNRAVGDAVAGQATGDVIRFSGAIANQTINLMLGELPILDDLVIDGGAQGISISGNVASRIFAINTNQFVKIAGLVLVNGRTNGAGGAISVAGGANAVFETLIISGSGAAGMGGGGIYNTGSTVTIIDSQISSNQATGAAGSGGGILNGAGGTLYVYTSTLSSNSAARAGGAIEDASGAGLGVVLRGTDVTSNSAGPSGTANPGNGGGLHVSGAGDVVVIGGFFDNNLAVREGGALWNGTGTMTLRGVRITNNRANGDAADDGGGGVFNNGGTLVVLDTLIMGNWAFGTAGSGGGIFSTSGAVNVTRSRISQNAAFRAGGGVELITGSFTALLTTISANTAGPLPSPNPGNGGGLHVTGAGVTVTLRASNVLNNRAAREGGGLWNALGSVLIVDQSTLNGNTAVGDAADDGGGAIFNNGGDVAITNSLIANNVANGTAGSGGAIFSTGGTVIVDRTTVSGNVANRAGGGIEVTSGSVVIYLSAVVGNTAGPSGTAAPGNGGGLHVSGAGSAVSIIGSNLRLNTARSEGGGLWNDAGSSMYVTNSNLIGNMALGTGANNGGGGIFNNGGLLDVVFSRLFNNTAAGDGAGLFLGAGGTARLIQSQVYQNTADDDGGGIYNDADLLLSNSSVNNNTADSGGGIFTDTNGVTTLSNSTVTSNTPDNLAGPGTVV